MVLPRHIYHLAEASNWPRIQRDGLLSASTLILNAGLKGPARARLEKSQRPAHIELPDGVHIRDQRPMPPKALESCLVAMSPAEWYALINSHVFFWIDPERLNRQRAACGSRAQVVLTVDTEALVDTHKKSIALTPINTGNARRKPAIRGAATFVPLTRWMDSGWRHEAESLGVSERKRSHEPVELTVRHAVPDIMRFVQRIDKLASGQPFVPKSR